MNHKLLNQARLREVCEGLIYGAVPPPGKSTAPSVNENGKRFYLGQSRKKMIGYESPFLQVHAHRREGGHEMEGDF